MSRESELLLSNLISSFKGRHNLYKKDNSEFSMWFTVMIMSALATPVIAFLFWALGETQMMDKFFNVLWVFIVYGLFILGMYYKVVQSKRRLNELKSQLEDANFRICFTNNMPQIEHKNAISEPTKTLQPFRKIDFKKYNEYCAS